ncbi:baseplate tail-tube junction protein [Vibrio alginolyticus]|nr:baseplate tail-tube junction protein [Vibrio alginolyticus]
MGVKITEQDAGLMRTAPSETSKALQYPLSLEKHASFLAFYSVSSAKSDLSSNALDERSTGYSKNLIESTDTTILLYMPDMQEQVNHQYSGDEPSVLQDAVVGYIEDGMSGALSRLHDRARAEFANLTQMNAAQTTSSILGNRASKMYTSSEPRTKTFKYQFRPRNVGELKQIGRIIKAFYIGSSAKRSKINTVFDHDFGSSFQALTVPNIWYVEERINTSLDPKLRHTGMFNFGPASITSIRTDKTPEQIYQSFTRTAGDPIAIDFEITMTELRPRYSDAYESDFESVVQ